MNYSAISTFGCTVVRGNSINVGQFTVGGWSQRAPASGLYVGGDTSLNGNVGIGTENPQAKLNVNGDLKLGIAAAGQNQILGAHRLLIQAGEHLYLLPGSGKVFVGGAVGPRSLQVTGNALVEGKFTSQTLELTSDKNAKARFESVDGREILHKVSRLPVSTWNYTNSPAVRHIGPTAQDFQTAFNFGEDDKHISVVDGIGVAIAGIQGLLEQSNEKDARIAALERELADLRQGFAARISSIESHFAPVTRVGNEAPVEPNLIALQPR
jgi:hypothetical protein